MVPSEQPHQDEPASRPAGPDPPEQLAVIRARVYMWADTAVRRNYYNICAPYIYVMRSP